MGGNYIDSGLSYLSTEYAFVKVVIDVSFGKAPELKREHNGTYAGIWFFSKDELGQSA